MKVSHTIKLETYSCQLTFVVTYDINMVCKDIYKKFKFKSDNDDYSESEGIVVSYDIGKYFLIIDLQYLSHNTIAHEIYHVVVRVTEERNIVDEEAQAWLDGHITGAIYKFLDKKKFKIKHGG